MNKICCENGVFFVNDLISENKMLFTYEEFKNHYNIRLNFIEYFSILSAIPHRWKLLIRGIGKLKLIENDIVDRLQILFKTIHVKCKNASFKHSE